MSYAPPAASPYPSNSPAPYSQSAPIPPPKPGPSSGRGTPTRGPPLPPAPQVSSQYGVQYDHLQSQVIGSQAYHRPPEAGWLPSGFQDRSTQDLHRLLENADLQAALLNNSMTSHPSLQASQAPLKQLLENNVALATALEQLESRLAGQRSATQSRLLSLRALEQQHRSKIVETEDKLQGFSPMMLYQRLNASMQEQDALVNVIEDSYLEQGGVASDKEVADFVRRLREAKRTAFLRTERKERWDEGRVGGWR